MLLQSVFLDSHHDRCSSLLNKLAYITAGAFDQCEAAMQPYTKTAFEFCSPEADRKKREEVRNILLVVFNGLRH